MRRGPFIFLALLVGLLFGGASEARGFTRNQPGPASSHVYTGGQLVCSFETNSTLFGGSDTNRVAYYYHEDNLNSSTALSSGGTTGTQIEVDAYYPFGRVMTASPQANFKVSRQFTGQVKDDDTGLCFYNTRYYDPLLDRFIQADTMIPDLGNPQSYNRYSYCLNNPLKYTDPSGHETKTSWYQDLGTIFGSWFASPPQKANDTQISLRTAALGNTENIMPAMASKSVEMTGQAVQTVVEQYVAGKALQVGGAAVSKMGGTVLSKVTGMGGNAEKAAVTANTAVVNNSAGVSSVLANANFAQRYFSETFSAGGAFAGQTIDEVAAALRSGQMSSSAVPIQYIIRDGNTLILNSRSAQALERAGIPRGLWNAVNKTGNSAAEARLTAQLKRSGLTSQGTPNVTPNNP